MPTRVDRRRFLTASALGLGSVTGINAFGGPFTSPRVVAGGLQDHALDRERSRFVLGHDLSILQQVEAAGKVFHDLAEGRGDAASRSEDSQPCERILARHGANYVRLRLWVNPPAPFNDLTRVLSMARRIKEAGLDFLLDIHYSDFWADPGHQTTPAAWQGQDLSTLSTTVYNYTKSVIASCAAQDTVPSIVQIGNEVTDGFLWPLGQLYVNGTQQWAQFTGLLRSGISGALAGNTTDSPMKIMIHIDRGGDNGGARYFYDHLVSNGISWDITGLSYYPMYHGPLSNLQSNLNDLGPRYGKDIVVVETAYPWTFADGDGYPNIVGPGTNLQTPYPATPSGQLAYLRNVLDIIRSATGSYGRGLVYWEPDWIPGAGWEPGAGDAWDNMTLFDFTGHALVSVRCYQDVARSNQ